MTNKRLISAFSSDLFCMATYSFSATLNSYFVQNFLLQSGFSYTELEMVEFYKLLGYIVPLFLLMLKGLQASKGILLLSLGIYLLSIPGILFMPPYRIMKFYNLAFTASGIAFSVTLLNKLLAEAKISKKRTVSLFFSAWVVGYLGAEALLTLFTLTGEQVNFARLVILNTIPIIGIWLIIIFSEKLHIKPGKNQPRFSLIVKNMELEVIGGFVIFYVLMVIFSGYEVYALTENLLILSITTAKYYMIGAILAGVGFAQIIHRPLNMHKVNIICLIMLALVFATMPIWGHTYYLSAIFWVIIGLLLYVFFISNLLLLTEKFEAADLNIATLTYCFAGAIGWYAGYITINTSEDTLGENGFLISISFVLITLMIYYMFRFKKDKLSKWTIN